MTSEKKVDWNKLLEEAVRELKPQLDYLRENDLKAKARQPTSA